MSHRTTCLAISGLLVSAPLACTGRAERTSTATERATTDQDASPAPIDDCVARNGGAAASGLPFDNGGGVDVHAWGDGEVQDFNGGRLGPIICMLEDGATTAWMVRGAIRDAYFADGGGPGALGYPREDEHLVSGAPFQQFDNGAIAWNGSAFIAVPGTPPSSEDAGDASSVTVDAGSPPVLPVIVYRGVNLAGAEFAADNWGGGALPGIEGKDYVYPDSHYADGYTTPALYASMGLTTFRLPFRWERLQPVRDTAFDATELGRLQTTVSDLEALGATVILDPHNYARYGADLIGSMNVPTSDFADFWSRLATTFRDDPHVLLNVMNEPHDMPTEQWLAGANAAIAAIRAAGAHQLILVPGNGWTGAWSWSDDYYGTPNAVTMLGVVDPESNFAFDVHQYLDDDSSGTHTSCTSTTAGPDRLSAFTVWLRANGKRAFLGELSGGSDPVCLEAIDRELGHLDGNADVWLGWTYWAAGPWWAAGTALEPLNGVLPAQVAILTKSQHLR